MHPIVLYLLKMLLCSGLLYAYYRAALYNERFHQWNRFYLLGAMLLSILLPFLEIPVTSTKQPDAVLYALEVLPWNNEMMHSSTQDAQNVKINWVKIGIVAWCCTAIIVFVLKLWTVAQLFSTLKQGERLQLPNGVCLVLTEHEAVPYSFLNWLFWKKDESLYGVPQQYMLEHEMAHIQQRHSFDKIFVETLMIPLWFNPIFRLMRKDLYLIHEFLADKASVQDKNPTTLAKMILQGVNMLPPPNLSHPFFTSSIKRRLVMITTTSPNRFTQLKKAAIPIIVIAITMLIACTSKYKDKEALAQTMNGLIVPLPKDYFVSLTIPNGSLIVLDQKIISEAEMRKLNADYISHCNWLSKEKAKAKYGTQAKEGVIEIISAGKATVAKQLGENKMPSFPDGQNGWTKYLQTNLKYPDLAIDNGISGVAKIAFTVTSEGFLKDLKIIENPGYGLGEEALRIIEKGPKWVPAQENGLAVEKRAIINITFKLE